MHGIKVGRLSLVAMALTLMVGVGASAQSPESSEVALPTAFEGRIVPSEDVRDETVTVVDGRTEFRGAAWAPIVLEMSDPRLDGDVTWSRDRDDYVGADGTYGLATVTWRIENDDGRARTRCSGHRSRTRRLRRSSCYGARAPTRA
jgi:hypothetical protein